MAIKPLSDKPNLSTEEKQKMANAINSYSLQVGSPLGDKYGMVWVEVGIKYNRHPYSLVAIALADTSLGKQVTTPFNLGNVGNTDSCPTCGTHTKSWDDGIESIGQTLTNQYLKNATKLCHLSRGGWKFCIEGQNVNNGKFYASSLTNWDRNSNYAMSWLFGSEFKRDYSIILTDYYNI